MREIFQLGYFAATMLFQIISLDFTDCSVCKVTINGKTYFSNNEDSWSIGSKVWFENKTFGNLDAIYIGYSDNLPQEGAVLLPDFFH